MAAHNDFGIKGEDIAIQYLRTKGYDIVDKNWRSGHKEIDVIATKDDTVVFVGGSSYVVAEFLSKK